MNRALLTGLASALAVLTLVLVGCAGQSPRPAPASAASDTSAALVTEIATTVSDLEASTKFFSDTLGAEVVDTREVSGRELDALLGVSGAQLRLRGLMLGDERLTLVNYLSPAGAPPRTDARSNDLDFQHIALVLRDMDRMHERVMRAGSTPVTLGGPQRIPESNAAAAGIRAFYFRDRDRRPLELIWYPKDKGAPRWQAQGGPLLLGIDHTAIAVSSTLRSRKFYEGQIGLRLRGQSFNEGVEQSALSAVDGARVRITALGGSSGPGIEFLEYEFPGPGEHPAALSPTTVGYWEVTIHVPNLEATVDALVFSGVVPISRRVALCETCIRGRRAFVVRDPDGHAVRIAGD